MDRGSFTRKIANLMNYPLKTLIFLKLERLELAKISKQIVDLHQGSISFASVQNEFFGKYHFTSDLQHYQLDKKMEKNH